MKLIHAAAIVLLFILTACSITTDEKLLQERTKFWEEVDDFTDTHSYYVDSDVWIDMNANELLSLQFQCHRKAHQPQTVGLVVNSVAGDGSSTKVPKALNAILYRRDNDPVTRYQHREHDWGAFTTATIDLAGIFGFGEPGQVPQKIKFRFVYGLNIFEAKNLSVDALSRSENVIDFVFDASDPAPAQFLKGCYPNFQKTG